MRHRVGVGWTLAGVLTTTLALAGCSDDGSDGGGTSGGATPRPALSQEESATVLLTEDEFPLEGYTRGEPSPVSTDLAVLDASALLDSEELEPECREAAELARAVLPPQAGTEVAFTSAGQGEEAGHEITVIVFSTVVEVDYFGAYADQARACGTVEEGGRVLELAPLETEGVQGYTLGTDLGGLRLDLVLAGRSDGFNHAVVTALDLPEEDAVRILETQMDKLAATG